MLFLERNIGPTVQQLRPITESPPIYLPEVQLKVPGGVFLGARNTNEVTIKLASNFVHWSGLIREFPWIPSLSKKDVPMNAMHVLRKGPRKNASAWDKTAMHPFLHPVSVMIALWISWQAEDEHGKAQDLDKSDLFRRYRKKRVKIWYFLTMPVTNTCYNMLQP